MRPLRGLSVCRLSSIEICACKTMGVLKMVQRSQSLASSMTTHHSLSSSFSLMHANHVRHTHTGKISQMDHATLTFRSAMRPSLLLFLNGRYPSSSTKEIKYLPLRICLSFRKLSSRDRLVLRTSNGRQPHKNHLNDETLSLRSAGVFWECVKATSALPQWDRIGSY